MGRTTAQHPSAKIRSETHACTLSSAHRVTLVTLGGLEDEVISNDDRVHAGQICRVVGKLKSSMFCVDHIQHEFHSDDTWNMCL